MNAPDSAEAVNVRIAELCGWTDFTFRGMLKPVELDYIAHGPSMKDGWRGPIPNYSGSLDAMHEAEKTLTRDEQYIYYNEACRILNDAQRETKNWIGATPFHYMTMTAAQRAAAFLTTKGARK